MTTNSPDTYIVAGPYEARQCPICKVWVYTAAGPFGEDGDPTKTLADYLHWENEHSVGAEAAAAVVSFPFFDYNTTSVQAVT